jgi:2-aminoadipate transaminase
MQALDLVFKLFVDPGDRVIVERPTYANAIATIHAYEGRFLEVPLDQEGLVVEELERALESGASPAPRIAYVIPTFQNPGGVTLSLDRRRRLLDLARRHGLLLVEDDAYREVRFEGEPIPSLFALDAGAGNVLSLNTFSKTLAPGLRIGWVAGPEPVIQKMIFARHAMDTCSNVLAQRMVARYLASGALDDNIARLNAHYRAKRDLMLAALEEQFGGLPGVRWTRPEGGWFIWMTLPPQVDAQRLFELAVEEGVAFVPGHAFAGEDTASLRSALRLNFTCPPSDHLALGISRLRRAYDRLVGQEGPR